MYFSLPSEDASVTAGTAWLLEYEAAGDTVSTVRKYSRQEVRQGCHNPRLSPSEPLLAANLAPPNRALQPSKTVPPSGDQVNEHMSLWGTFHTQATIWHPSQLSIEPSVLSVDFFFNQLISSQCFQRDKWVGPNFTPFLKLNNIALHEGTTSITC